MRCGSICAVFLVLSATPAQGLLLGHTPALPHRIRGGASRHTTIVAEAGPPVAIVVEVEIKPDRMDDFLKAITIDVQGSRQEEGCLRFDLLRDNSNPNKFFFYEVYVDAAAVDVHKATPHFKAWSDFKESGGVVSQTSSKCAALDFTA